ncbi:MAG: NTP transferase domain-containing protein [Phycisphaerales bacterium]|nr:NTP transferase domain-containing protein [Phycisphaerales bacterium]
MSPASSTSPSAIILAAGKGTRMKGDLPKVCFPVGGRAMVCAVVDACIAAGCADIVIVVGYKQELVREALKGYSVRFAVQDEQLGTGHAVGCAKPLFEGMPASDVFVLCGDGPLIRASTLTTVLARHRATHAAATLATSVIDDPAGYGRIVRDAQGRFLRIVEQKNATEQQRAIREVNPSYYCFRSDDLFRALAHVRRNEVGGEYYLTDVPELLAGEGKTVELVDEVVAEDVLSINTPEDLAHVDALYQKRQARPSTASPQPCPGGG